MHLAQKAMRWLLLSVVLVGLVLPARADPVSGCNVSLDQVRLANPLARFAQRLVSEEPITIVAIGSSSTAGAGASSAAASYPNRLAVELKQHFPNHSITVINRGVGGEEFGDMLKRFDTGVLAEHPDLVLWQLGTNSVIRDDKLSVQDTSIRDGLKKIRAIGADAVLIDPQFAPKVIVKARPISFFETNKNSANNAHCSEKGYRAAMSAIDPKRTLFGSAVDPFQSATLS
jgi:acyl-CoA thioesterase I